MVGGHSEEQGPAHMPGLAALHCGLEDTWNPLASCQEYCKIKTFSLGF